MQPGKFRFVFALAALMTAAAFPAVRPAGAVPVQEPHLTVDLISRDAAIQPGSSFDAGLYFKLDPGWHVYWQNAGDSGLPPTVHWTLPASIRAGAMEFPAPQRLPLGPLMDYGYEGEVLFPVPMRADASLKPGSSVGLAAKVDWLVCREVCLPGKANLTLDLPVAAEAQKGSPQAAKFDVLASRLPHAPPDGAQAVFAPTASGFRLALLTGKRESSAQFFPFDQGQIENPAPQPSTPLANGIQLELKRDGGLHSAPPELHGLVVLADGAAYEVHAHPGKLAAPPGPAGWLTVLRTSALALAGGILLNLMPCVFPVLFIKGLALVQSSAEERSRLRAHGLVYTAGILVSFWAVVGALLLLRAGGSKLGWGFQFQSPAFLALMSLLLFFLGLSLAGQFEIGLTLTGAGSGLANRSGYAGSFFTGVLAMVVATPCTAPFMGAAIGFALAQPALVTFAIFTALALGLALPYLLLTLQPAWTRLLPRPGAWMEVLKQATAVPVFATVIWLLWVFAQSAGVNALPGLLAGLLLLAVAGWVLSRWPARRLPAVFAIVIVAFSVAASLYAVRTQAPSATSAAGTGASTPEGWGAYSSAAVEKYRAAGRPVFVDFTASWCLSCQVNERVVLTRPDVKKRFAESGVVLLRADWTQRDETIAQALNELGRSGVPTYALYPADPGAPAAVLPEVLTPAILFHALDGLRQPARAGLGFSPVR